MKKLNRRLAALAEEAEETVSEVEIVEEKESVQEGDVPHSVDDEISSSVAKPKPVR